MPRPLLLIVDGESIRTRELDSALEADGWGVRWIRSEEAHTFLATALVPDLLLLDPFVAGGEGYTVVRALRARKPRMPVVALADGPFPHSALTGPEVDVQVHLNRAQGAEALAAWLHRFHPGDPQRGSDGIFSVPLEESQPSPAAQTPDATLEATRAQAAGMSPDPAAPAQQAEGSPAGAAPLVPAELTFSGISGVKDPFDWTGPMVPPAPERAPLSPTHPQARAILQTTEEYGNYILLEKIAVGGMAELFKAQQRGLQGFQKIVAIKRILAHFSDNEDFVKMFIDEAKLAAQLSHPNIVQIFDLGKSGRSYYIAMEYVNGRDLRTLLRKVREYGATFPEQVAAFVAMKVAAALDYAHRKRGYDDRELKLVHRDVSPQNVILSTEGAVKLVDFGIAKAASKASTTMAGALKGKLLYMSPEQATGQPLDNRSDLYSLGLVLFELLTGARCFQSDSEVGVLEKVRQGRISDLATMNPNVSREMVAIVNRALQKSVDHRYPSARFMERDLREYLQRQGAHITEHDVAEYANTLLSGSKESLETLVASRFPAPAGHSSGAHRRVGAAKGAATASPPGTISPLESPVEPTAAPASAEVESSRPRWLLPVILVLAVLLVILLAVAGWS